MTQVTIIQTGLVLKKPVTTTVTKASARDGQTYLAFEVYPDFEFLVGSQSAKELRMTKGKTVEIAPSKNKGEFTVSVVEAPKTEAVTLADKATTAQPRGNAPSHGFNLSNDLL